MSAAIVAPMAPERDPGEIELRDYLQVLARRWLVIAVVVIVVIAAAALMTFTQQARYRAEAEVQIREPLATAAVGAEAAVALPEIGDEVRIARSTGVTDEVRDAFGSEPALSVRSDEDESLVIVRAVSEDPALAADAANLHAQTFLEHRREALLDEYRFTLDLLEERDSELADDLTELRDDLAEAEAGVDPDSPNRSFEIDRIRADHDRRAQPIEDEQRRVDEQMAELRLLSEFVATDGAQVVTSATEPGSPFEPTTTRNLAVAVAVGLFLGVAAAFALEFLDRSIRTPADLERAALGLPVLATIPTFESSPSGSELAMRDHPRSPSAESYRVLRASLRTAIGDEPSRTLGVLGVAPDAGATTTAANVALAWARSGHRVVLIDADLRRPRMHHLFGLDNELGLTSVLRDDTGLDAVAHRLGDDTDLVVVPAGPLPTDPAELLGGTGAASLVASIAGEADLVIVDLPPVLAAADVFAALPWLDASLLVASAGRTRDDDVTEAVIELDRAGARLLGTVLNRGESARVDTYVSQ